MREERVDVALAAHAEQMEIEALGRVFLELGLVGLGGGFHGDGAEVISVDVGLGDVDVLEERAAGLALVRVRVRGGHVALVAEEDVHAGPVNAQGREVLALGVRCCVETGELTEHSDARATTGEHDACDAIPMDSAAGRLCGGHSLDESEGGLTYEFLKVVDAMNGNHGYLLCLKNVGYEYETRLSARNAWA